MNILLVEDTPSAIKTCEEMAENYNRTGKNISLIIAKSFNEALAQLNQEIDVAIVDIKLNSKDSEDNEKNGNDVISKMQELCLRIPTVIHTGTPDDVTVSGYLHIFTRGDGYKKIFDYLIDVNNTGLVNILGRKGLLEEKLNTVFIQNVLPVINNSWIQYGKENQDTSEKALLRFILNHLMQHLENTDDVEKCYPEEMYIFPPVDSNYRTGSIVKDSDENFFIILSPACDLALHNGAFKTDRILLAEIKNVDKIIEIATKKCEDKEERNRKMINICTNTHALYYHWLPSIYNFPGGIINFRRLNSYKKSELQKNFGDPIIQVSPFFCKDIVSRFSSYYARQGQPDIDYSGFISNY